MSRDIVDEIDALVDEQLAGGESRQGYDFGDPTYPKCPHCDRHWHGLAVTERIDTMYRYGRYDEDYVAAEDDSRVLCRGSDFIGPMAAEVFDWGTKRQRVTVVVGGTGTELNGVLHRVITLDRDAPTITRFPSAQELEAAGWQRMGMLSEDEPAIIHHSPDVCQVIVGGRQPVIATDYIENATIRGTAE